jgi:RNA polymerase sporulation-specific sigma factor
VYWYAAVCSRTDFPAVFLLLLSPLKKYYTQNGDQEDLISIGTIGLIKGITSFNPEKGARLATYAARCIENAILSQRNKRGLMRKTMQLLVKNGPSFST